MSSPPGGEAVDRFAHEGAKLYSLRQVNELPESAKEEIYRHLVPTKLLLSSGIHPETLRNHHGDRLVSFTCPAGSRLVVVDVRPEVGFPDPLLYVELCDTRLNQIEVLLLVVNDPEGDRYNTDRDWRGERTEFGVFKRNVPEEIKAMQAGLAPGQVRRGLRVIRSLIPRFEDFCRRLGHDYYLMEPLAYHNAIILERLGCNYVQGRRRMGWIDSSFQPGGTLCERLDGSTPFRQADAWRTVRGRSWAIHDGILGEPWSGIRMYKQAGHGAGVDSFPGGPY